MTSRNGSRGIDDFTDNRFAVVFCSTGPAHFEGGFVEEWITVKQSTRIKKGKAYIYNLSSISSPIKY
ncbi:hypothetical protein BPOR_1441g00020 [Botrytis porri]|uniref:Uncharacterized protein n=1 Tax=Botrytis porri TaxID=87229 RepID=A0A4Z1K5R9_9HELO|nr:hypothetical protein BPOR_1441g00020 [Botrytis porri]